MSTRLLNVGPRVVLSAWSTASQVSLIKKKTLRTGRVYIGESACSASVWTSTHPGPHQDLRCNGVLKTFPSMGCICSLYIGCVCYAELSFLCDLFLWDTGLPQCLTELRTCPHENLMLQSQFSGYLYVTVCRNKVLNETTR